MASSLAVGWEDPCITQRPAQRALRARVPSGWRVGGEGQRKNRYLDPPPARGVASRGRADVIRLAWTRSLVHPAERSVVSHDSRAVPRSRQGRGTQDAAGDGPRRRRRGHASRRLPGCAASRSRHDPEDQYLLADLVSRLLDDAVAARRGHPHPASRRLPQPDRRPQRHGRRRCPGRRAQQQAQIRRRPLRRRERPSLRAAHRVGDLSRRASPSWCWIASSPRG